MADYDTPRRGDTADDLDPVSEPKMHSLGELDGYYLTKQLGKGGMGNVYLAVNKYNPEMRRALKVILPESDRQLDELVDRWKVECAVSERLRGLKHHHIVQVYDGKQGEFYDGRETESVFYIAMEYVDGATLTKLMQNRALSIEDGLKIGLDISSALEAAHDIGIAHRDVKPSNIVIDDATERNMHAYLLDFGVAKMLYEPAGMTQMHGEVTVGTLNYMPPEELRKILGDDSMPTTEKGDIWSWGKVCYEMFAKIAMQDEPTEESRGLGLSTKFQKAIAWRARPIRDVPAELNALIANMTTREPGGRPDARDVRAAFGQLLYLRDAGAGTQPITIGPQEVRLEQLVNDIRSEHLTQEDFVRKQGLFMMVPADGYTQATNPNMRVDGRLAREMTYFKIFAPQAKRQWIFGRGEGVDCRYKEPTMSKTHFAITRLPFLFEGKERYTITDLESSNGTYLRGLRLEPKKSELITTGDEIRAGNTRIVFALPAEARQSVDTIQFKVERQDKTPKQKRLSDQQGA